MPEFPDVELYVHCLRSRIVGTSLEQIAIVSPFVLRSVEPPVDALEGLTVRAVSRIGKRIVLAFGPAAEGAGSGAVEPALYVVLHLMIAGRLRWHRPEHVPKRPRILAAELAFATGTLWMTEAGARKRAALHVVRGDRKLRRHDPGGLEPLEVTADAFTARLRSRRRTLKRALTDPTLCSGIGNAYSDEILHGARLSPFRHTTQLTEDEAQRLHAATVTVLTTWRDRLVAEIGDGFPGPGAVTAFRPDMAVHGRFGLPCPVCAALVQRVVLAEREFNYCPGCQTEGRILADRALSRLLRDDWPRTLDELE